jgi:hypothetical protein
MPEIVAETEALVGTGLPHRRPGHGRLSTALDITNCRMPRGLLHATSYGLTILFSPARVVQPRSYVAVHGSGTFSFHAPV